MKIISIIVDKKPESCSQCEREKKECDIYLFLNEEERKEKVHPDCILQEEIKPYILKNSLDTCRKCERFHQNKEMKECFTCGEDFNQFKNRKK